MFGRKGVVRVVVVALREAGRSLADNVSPWGWTKDGARLPCRYL